MFKKELTKTEFLDHENKGLSAALRPALNKELLTKGIFQEERDINLSETCKIILKTFFCERRSVCP